MIPTPSPFTVYIDSAESHPYTFEGIAADSVQTRRKHADPILTVPHEFRCLGRHPNSLGDYSAEGLIEIAHVERKSKEDYWGTLLGWTTGYEADRELPGRRERFTKELENLSSIPCPLVVVEASFGECLATCPQWGKKPAGENAKHLNRKTLSLQCEYRVPFLFCDSRRLAEVVTYRHLTTAWRLLQEGRL